MKYVLYLSTSVSSLILKGIRIAISFWFNKLFLFFSELCWGKAMVACKMPQQRKKEESERLRGEGEIRSSLFILDLKDGKL